MSAITSLEDLCVFLNLDLFQRQRLTNIPSFPLLLPMHLANKIQKGTLDDPILKQFVPLDHELEHNPLFGKDPVGDLASCKTKRLLKKYKNRALLMPSAACAMNCRFCFRRSYGYEHSSQLDEELDLISKDLDLNEIILSGGDPLSLSNRALERLIKKIETFDHIKRLRFHTRYPIGYPHRIDEGFIAILKNSRLQFFFTLHINHPIECDDLLLSKLKQLPCPVLTQTVLLKGINDDKLTLKTLFERLSDHGILPYYLHQLDRVEGAGHFEVPIQKGLAIMQQLAEELSGYALPRYVKEVAGALHKVEVSKLSSFVE
jgi:EF-P beta-lysylation protein EpmB